MVRSIVSACLIMALSAAAWAQSTAYVTDELTVAVRRGKSLQHRILRFIPSGTPVEVLETSDEDGFTLVRTSEGTEGWVQTDKLSDQPGAAARLESAQRQLAKLRSETSAQREKLAELETALEARAREVAGLEAQVASQGEQLDEARALAAEPLLLAEDNSRLTAELDQAVRRVASLEEENASLRSRSLKEWFLVGAAVSLGSLFLGILMTRIRWRRERWDFH